MKDFRLIRYLEPASTGSPRPRVAIIHPSTVAALVSAPNRDDATFVMLTTGGTIEVFMRPEDVARDLGIALPNADT